MSLRFLAPRIRTLGLLWVWSELALAVAAATPPSSKEAYDPKMVTLLVPASGARLEYTAVGLERCGLEPVLLRDHQRSLCMTRSRLQGAEDWHDLLRPDPGYRHSNRLALADHTLAFVFSGLSVATESDAPAPEVHPFFLEVRQGSHHGRVEETLGVIISR